MSAPRWLNRTVLGIGLASLFSDWSHEIATTLMPTFLGAMMIAAGKASGDGTLKIVEADPASGIAYTLDFNHGMQVFAGALRYTNTSDGLRVTWTLDADLGMNPLKRWAGLGMGSLMSGDMEHGLAKLKVYVEEKR